ncbi:MAG: hypothetical protein JSR91_01250 [Proteobacteria bacterium]|nr:hypothetical protein [Pseudomonadota bacterium]
MTGLLGIVCALLGMLVAPSLLLLLAIAFSAVALVRSLAIFNIAGILVAAMACILTVVGMVLFPLGSTRAPGMAMAAGQSQVAVVPPADVTQQPAPGLTPKATDSAVAAGSLSLPSSPPAPEPQAVSADPSQAAQPEVAPTRAPPEAIPAETAKPREEALPAAAAESSPPPNTPPHQQTLDEALPEPPPQAAAVVPDPIKSNPAAEAPKTEEPVPVTAPATTPVPVREAAKVNSPVWPESRTEQTKAIQVLLRDLDFYHGTTNGTFGPATRAAICLYLVTYAEKGECEPSKALFDSLQKRRANANVGSAPR